MKFLVLGCNGMAGHMVSMYLKEKDYEVTGFARRKSPYVNSVAGRAEDMDGFEEFIAKHDIVINCIGMLNNATEENKADAVWINSYFPHKLVKITEKRKTKIIHISTDCVFSGNRGEYSEYDIRDGITFYDRSKAMGEIDDEKNVTIRTSIVGPDLRDNGSGLLNWFMQQDEVDGYTKAIWTGQTTLQLAKTIEKVAKSNAYGIYNLVPDYSISKYDLLRLFNRYLRGNSVKIRPVDRPIYDKSLKRTRYDLDYKVPAYEKMVEELGVWMREHRYMYPHYRI